MNSVEQNAAFDVKQFVDGLISGRKVVVFSKTYCPHCTKAKKALEGFTFVPESMEIVELDDHPECAAIQDYLLELTKGRTVPRVFISGAFLGGGDDTVNAAKSGELEQKLRECGAIA